MKKALSLILVLAMLVSLTACGQGGQQSAASTEGESTAKRDDVNIALGEVIGTTDPHMTSSINGKIVLNNAYEGLFFVGDDGSLTPQLAESYDVSDDNLTYTVHLRSGVKFHNGETMTADDVAYSLQHGKEAGRYSVKYAHLVNWEVVDEKTIKLTTDAPVATFMMGINDIKIVSKKDGEAFGDSIGIDIEHTLAGTGPYYFTEFNPDTSIKLEAFKDYYRGEATIKKINFKVMTDSSTIIAALETGEVDFASISTGNVEVVEKNENLEVIKKATTHNSFIKFNVCDKEILRDKRIRQAVCFAINKEEVLYGCYDGFGDVAGNFARVGMMIGATEDGVETYEYNPAKAKELLAAAGYPNGIDLGTIWAQTTMYFSKAAQIILQQLADVGITVKLVEREAAAFNDAVYRGKEDWDICFGGNIRTGDSDEWYDWVFNPESSNYLGMGASGRYMINEHLVELGEKAKMTMDPVERNEVYKEFWQLAQDEAYIISIFHRNNIFGQNKNLNTKLYQQYYYVFDWSWK